MKDLDQCSSGNHRNAATSLLKAAGLVNETVDTPEKVEMEKSAFADPDRTLWPINTPEQIRESAASLMMQKDFIQPRRYSRLLDNVKHAATLHNMLHEVMQLQGHVAAQLDNEKRASVVAFALPAHGWFPISTEEQVVKSAASFSESRKHLTFVLRKEAAENILGAADKFGVSLDDNTRSDLEVSACRGMGSPFRLARALARRGEKIARRCPSEGVAMLHAAIAIVQNEDMGIEDYVKTAKRAIAAMDELDDKYRLRSPADPLPEDEAFPHSLRDVEKVAGSLVQLGDCAYRRVDIAKIPASAFDIIGASEKVAGSDGSHVDPDKLAEVCKEADSSLVDRVLSGYGVREVGLSDVDSKQGTGKIVPADWIQQWSHVAAGYGSDIKQDNNGFTFNLSGAEGIPIGTAAANA